MRLPQLDAHEWVMLTVVGVGIYAAIRLAKTSAGTPQTPNQLAKPTPLDVPSGPLPNLPGPTPPLPSNIRFIEGSPLKLEPAAWYHGRLETRPGGLWSASSSRELIQRGLENMGFSRVQVFMTPQEAAQDIFQSFALANPGSGTRWFRARWPLVIERPLVYPGRFSDLTLLWQAAPPR